MTIRLPERVRRYILQLIAEQGLGAGAALPTEHELARVLSVSRNTIRQALEMLEHEGTIYRIQGSGTFVAGENSPGDQYGPSDFPGVIPAAVSRREVTRLVGLIMPFTDGYLNLMIQSITSVLRTYGYQLIVSNSHNRADEEASILHEMMDQGIRGVMVFPCSDFNRHDTWQTMTDRKYPYVLMMRHREHEQEDAVCFENETATFNAVLHLARCGYKRIAFVGGPEQDVPPHTERYQGYLRGLARAGMAPDARYELIDHVEGHSSVDSAVVETRVETLTTFLETVEKPAGVFAVNDLRANLVYQAARQVGLRIPEDIGVVGFDDRDFAALLDVPLTTVHQDITLLGEMAARRLIDRLIGQSTIKPGLRRLPLWMVLRSSCGELYS
ncbi:MAG: GntR family transcriptional regulator [Spirochaetaceae bacterium]|nr:MAG: GntR family transcriptional regulator [Spirochaetaceae bacterium]